MLRAGTADGATTLTSIGASATPCSPATLILTSREKVPVHPSGSEKLRPDGGGPLKAHTPGDSSVPALSSVPAGNPPSTTRSTAPPEPATWKRSGVVVSTDVTSSSGNRRAALLGALSSIWGIATGAGASTAMNAPPDA